MIAAARPPRRDGQGARGDHVPKPGARYGDYPERRQGATVWPFYPAQALRSGLSLGRAPSPARQARFLAAIHAHREQLSHAAPEAWIATAREMRAALNARGLAEDLLARAFALLDACLHRHLALRLHDSQFIAAWYLLQRRLVEMQTGEGKTLAVALAAMTAALAGIPVHVVTANDYLVRRDAAALGAVCAMLGLEVGAVAADTPVAGRGAIYACDIVYCTANELVFDYLRDHLAAARRPAAPGRKLRGLCLALVDEADNILIDDARTPLILSEGAPREGHATHCRQMLFIAGQLREGEHFLLERQALRAALTDAGAAMARTLWQRMGGQETGERARRESLCSALAATHLFVRDRHYLVAGGKVEIVDAGTGRVATGRIWAQGLHQMIETREGCAVTEAQVTVAQMTFQRFFRRYLWLAGISGTLHAARHELAAVYGLPVLRVRLQFASRRKLLPSLVFRSRREQWDWVAGSVEALRQAGRPVLVATEGVLESQELSALFARRGIAHAVLNAATGAGADAGPGESGIVAAAGNAGAVTISTNIAGRGTDIRLAEAARRHGGLHVIACQSNDSRRIDLQLYGRSARQGEPGSAQHLYRLDQPHCGLSAAALGLCALVPGLARRARLPGPLVCVARLAAWRRARAQQKQRWNLLLHSLQLENQLAFSGQSE